MKETQQTINEWCIKTFGQITNADVAIARMLSEVSELELIDYKKDPNSFDKVSDECADILITLYRIADVFGFDLHACVDHKMDINRGRKWALKGDGTGYHIKE